MTDCLCRMAGDKIWSMGPLCKLSPCSDEKPYPIKKIVTTFMRLKMLVETLAALQVSKGSGMICISQTIYFSIFKIINRWAFEDKVEDFSISFYIWCFLPLLNLWISNVVLIFSLTVCSTYNHRASASFSDRTELDTRDAVRRIIVLISHLRHWRRILLNCEQTSIIPMEIYSFYYRTLIVQYYLTI